MRARMQSLSDSDPGSDDQPQWYQDWCQEDYGGYGSSGSSDEPLPMQCAGCDESFVLGGGYCRVCREDGTEAEARRFCVAPVMEVDAGDDEGMEHTSCVMCRAEFCKLQSAERICDECVAITTQPDLVETPDRVTVVRNAVYVPPASETHTEDVTARLQEMNIACIEIGSAEGFAANVTQTAQQQGVEAAAMQLVSMQSGRPPRKKHRVITSDSDEEEFKMRIRSARMCMGETTSSDEQSESSGSSGPEDSDGELEFQRRCALKGAGSPEQVEAAELAFEAQQQGLLVTGKRERRQAKTKLQAAVEEQPEIRVAMMADVASEEDEALLDTESSSDGSADRPGGNSDGEGDYICSCPECDMPSETWVGDEPRCAQCAGPECSCECNGCGEAREEGSKQGQQCRCKDCEHSAEPNAANCKQCMQLRLLKGRLVKACGCSCNGCSDQGDEQPEHPAAGEAESGSSQVNSTMGETQHQQSEVIRNSAGTFMRSCTAADGHCLYRGVSEHITGGQAAFSQMRWAAAGWLKEHWEQMKPSYQLSKKKVLNAIKFGAAEHMKKGTIRQVPAWAWGGEQEIIALAETFGVVIMVQCSRDGNVHRYGERGEEKWLYFDQAREHYEAMHQVDGDMLIANSSSDSSDEDEDEMPELESIMQRHTMPWACGKCTYVNAGSEAGFLRCGACDSERECEQQLQCAEREQVSERVQHVVCAPAAVADSKRARGAAAAEEQQVVHVPLAYGITYHVSECCSELDPGSATISVEEADERGMLPCPECTMWTEHERLQHEQQLVMLPAGSGKCFHSNERCPALQWGHRLCSKREARLRMKYQCSHCAQQERAPTWEIPEIESPLKETKHTKDEDIRSLRVWCMRRGLPAYGQQVDLIRRLQRHDDQQRFECVQCGHKLADVCAGCRCCMNCMMWDGQSMCRACQKCVSCCDCAPPAYSLQGHRAQVQAMTGDAEQQGSAGDQQGSAGDQQGSAGEADSEPADTEMGTSTAELMEGYDLTDEEAEENTATMLQYNLTTEEALEVSREMTLWDMQYSDGVSGKATNCVQELPAIPENAEVGPYDMQTIWRRAKAAYHSVVRKRKVCTIAPAVGMTRVKESKKLGAYVARSADGGRMVIAPDTCAEVSMARAGIRDASWRPVEAEPVTAQGLSESTTELNELVCIPMRMRCGAPIVEILCRVTPDDMMPDGVDVFLGTGAQHKMGAKVDVKNDRMELWEEGMIIDLEPVRKLHKRMRMRPQNVIDVCSGMSGARAVLEDLGYNIGSWLAVENNSRVSAAVPYEDVKHSKRPDVMKHTAESLLEELGGAPQWFFAGPNCQQFSAANPDAQGMASKGGDLFQHVCELASELLDLFPNMKYCVENVVPKSKLKEETLLQWNALVQVPFEKLNAASVGAATSRPRMVSTNITAVKEVRRKPSADPNIFLESSKTECRTMPCVMTCPRATWNPLKVTDKQTYQERFASPDELMKLMGYQLGSLKSGTSDREKEKMLGNAFHYQLIRSLVVGERQQKAPMYRATKAESKQGAGAPHGPFEHASAAENKLHAMADEELEAHIKHNLKDYQEMKLKLFPKATGAPYQIPRHMRFSAPQGRRAAVLAGLRQRLERRHIRLVQYSEEQYISMMFVKFKGRIDPETEMEAWRALNDLRAVNSELDWPKWWEHITPTIEHMCQQIPAWAEFYAGEDIQDAYEGMKLDAGSAHMVTCVPPMPLRWDMFTPEELLKWGLTAEEIGTLDWESEVYLQWDGCPQGLAPAAPGFNLHMAHGFNTALGLLWSRMWILYTDDLLLFGESAAHVEAIQRICAIVLRQLGKKVSPKCDRTVKTNGEHVGLSFTKGGVQLSDATVEQLKRMLDVMPKGKKQMQRLLGTIVQATTAFEFDNSNKTWLAEKLSILTQASTAEPFQCTAEVKQTIREMATKVVNSKRRLINPDDLITDDCCVVISSDASDEGCGASLGVVMKADGRDVTPEDLHNTELYQLVAPFTHVFSSAEKRMLTFERETQGMYLAVDRWRKVIAKAAARFPHVDAGGKVKVLLMMDNTTATSKWMSLGVPISLDHTSAKGQKYACMADEMAFLTALPVEARWIPGECLSFPDMLSRIEQMMKEATALRKAAPKMAAPLSVHTYYPESKGKSTCHLPEGASVIHLRLGKEGNRKPHEAQLADTERYHNVPMGTIAAAAMGIPGGDPALRVKAEKYVGTLFFGVTPPGSDLPLLYTPSASQRRHEVQQMEEAGDATKRLVVVVPKAVKLKVSSAEDLYTDDEKSPAWMRAEMDLRKDIILMCHDMAQHPKIAPTLHAVKAMASWIGQRSQVREHIDSCADCLEERKAVAEIGAGIVSAARGDVIQMDHYVLSKDEAALAGVPVVLTICDVATRATEFEAAETQTAGETARLIFTRWIRYRSCPRMIITDGHPHFVGEVLKCLRKLMGIAAHDVAAPRAKGKVALVEAKHRPLSEVLADGFAKGDIKCRDDLEMYLASAVMRVNQTAHPGRVSPFHLLHGQPPVHVRTLTMQTSDKMPKELTAEDQKLAEMIKYHVDALMQHELACRDDEARDNVAKRVANQPHSGYTQFELKEGDKVSHKGRSYTLIKKTGYGAKTVTATLEAADGKTKRARFDELRPLATPRPVKYISDGKQAVAGELVFFDTDEGVTAGTVMMTKGGRLTVQRMESNDTARVWLPLWQSVDEKTVIRKRKQPTGAEPLTMIVKQADVMLVGKLSATGHLTDETRKALKAMVLTN